MKICKIEPNKEMKIIDLNIELNILQNEVKGNIEYLNAFDAFESLCNVWNIDDIDSKYFIFLKKFVFILNDDFLFREDLKQNGVIFKGNVLVLKEIKHDKPSDITDGDMSDIKNLYFLFFNTDVNKCYKE